MMDCLEIGEIIAFVSMRRMDDESLALASRVTEHIRECPECMERVKVFQDMKDALGQLIIESALEGKLDRETEKTDASDMSDGIENG